MATGNIYGSSFDAEGYLCAKLETPPQPGDFRYLLNERDKQLTLDFCTAKIAEGKTPSRVYKYVKVLTSWMPFLNGKHWEELATQDVMAAVAGIERSKYAPNTRMTYKNILKVFFRWLKKCPSYKDPPETEWLKCSCPKPKRYSSKEMLTIEDIHKMISTTNDTMFRAFVVLLFDSGMRIGELMALKVKDIQFDPNGATIHVPDDPGCKTGSRDIYVVVSASYLSQWLNAHAAKDDPNAYIFYGSKPGKLWLYGKASARLRELIDKAGIKKQHNFHFFRKSRASCLAIGGWSQQQLNAYFGWCAASDMSAVYVHMGAQDTKLVMQRMYGIKPEEKAIPYAANLNCEFCKTLNPAGSSNCHGCNSPIDGREKTMQNAELKRLEQLLGILKSKQTTQG